MGLETTFNAMKHSILLDFIVCPFFLTTFTDFSRDNSTKKHKYYQQLITACNTQFKASWIVKDIKENWMIANGRVFSRPEVFMPHYLQTLFYIDRCFYGRWIKASLQFWGAKKESCILKPIELHSNQSSGGFLQRFSVVKSALKTFISYRLN